MNVRSSWRIGHAQSTVKYRGLQAAMASRIAAIQSGLRAGGLSAEQFQIFPRSSRHHGGQDIAGRKSRSDTD